MNILFSNTNSGTVSPGALPATIQLATPTLIAAAHIVTFASQDELSFRNAQTGAVLGPYPWIDSVSWPGGGRKLLILPNVTLPAGTYQVVVGNAAQWAENPASKGQGFVQLEGQAVSMPSGNAVQIFTNVNTAAVQGGGGALRPMFTLATPMMITRIEQYHYNNGQGATGVVIQLFTSLWSENFIASGSTGSGAGLVNWIATPNIMLPAGSYLVGTSSLDTWSYNAGSAGEGFVTIYGV